MVTQVAETQRGDGSQASRKYHADDGRDRDHSTQDHRKSSTRTREYIEVNQSSNPDRQQRYTGDGRKNEALDGAVGMLRISLEEPDDGQGSHDHQQDQTQRRDIGKPGKQLQHWITTQHGEDAQDACSYDRLQR